MTAVVEVRDGEGRPYWQVLLGNDLVAEFDSPGPADAAAERLAVALPVALKAYHEDRLREALGAGGWPDGESIARMAADVQTRHHQPALEAPKAAMAELLNWLRLLRARCAALEGLLEDAAKDAGTLAQDALPADAARARVRELEAEVKGLRAELTAEKYLPPAGFQRPPWTSRRVADFRRVTLDPAT